MQTTIQRGVSALLMGTSFLYVSCDNNSIEEVIEQENKFDVTIHTNYEEHFLDVQSSNRLMDESSLIPNEIDILKYYLRNEDGTSIEEKTYFMMSWEGKEIPQSITLPRLDAGNYILSIGAEDYQTANIPEPVEEGGPTESITVLDNERLERYTKYLEFSVAENTTLDVTLEQHQTRYKFVDTSNFSNAEVKYVSFTIENSGQKFYDWGAVDNIQNWDNPSDKELYSSVVQLQGLYSVKRNIENINTEFMYRNPVYMTGITVKFFSSFNDVIYSTTLDQEDTWLLDDNSYTFNVDLDGIFLSGESGDVSSAISYETTTWTENTIDVN
ncbi:hypothetical protein [Flammeovirga aprica]|uniref:Uncharacterized protein n=1 Tax=Flammeovirga aprica JL-4 TaxID=694437 RepID=A0A7X9S1R5_9BACT|nr:hypothetical protein [Flammeovirga aprica]NME72798.1 hypothetical protein [Flammeovirga aprica JL-4]